MSGRSPKGPWKLFIVHLAGGFKVSTFERSVSDKAVKLTGKLVNVAVTPGKKEGTWNLLDINEAPIETGYEPGDESNYEESSHGGDE